MTVTQAPFGATPDGAAVHLFTLKNSHGVEVRAKAVLLVLLLESL